MRLDVFSRDEKKLLLVLAFIQLTHIVDFMILMPLGPTLIEMFGLKANQFGFLVSSYSFAAGATGLVSSFFIDRFDRKKSLLFFYFGFSIGTILCALSPGYETLLMARTLTGAFGGVLGSLVFSIVGDSISQERRATAIGVVMASFSIASVFGVPFSLFIAEKISWHAPFFFLGALSLAFVGLIFYAVPAQTRHLESRQVTERWYAKFLGVIESRNQMLAILFQSSLVFSQFAVIPFLSQSFVFNAGLTTAQLPLIYLVGGVISIFSSPWLGRLSDTYGKRRVFVAGATGSLIPFYVVTHLGPSPVWWTLFIVAIFFLCMGGRMVPSVALVTSTVKPQSRGTFMSLLTSTQSFAQSLAAYVAGHIVEKSAEGPFRNYDKVGWIAIGVTVVTLFLVQFIHPVEGEDL